MQPQTYNMEALVRIVDKPLSGDASLDAKRTRAGDVIVVMPDGHSWGKQELSNPEWRIISIPDLRAADAISLTSPEAKVGLNGSTKMLQKRAIRLDLSNVKLPKIRSGKGVDIVLSRGQVMKATVVKPPVADPNIISL